MTTFTPPCGPVTGRRDGAVVRATGVPYARAERFAAPHPVEWSQPLAALHPAPACPQVHDPVMDPILGRATGGLPEDEDCQNLSITLPADLAPDERLPVMVWIHGGSYVFGAGDAPLYDAASLVSEQRVVVVSVTYRLGLLGYYGGGGRTSNLGLLDQIAALEWVQRNIAAFGGDPQRVTVFGQSAGGDAVAHIMATPDARRLMRRAIIQSAPLGISRRREGMRAAMVEAGRGIRADAPVAEIVATQAAVQSAAAPFGLRGLMSFGTEYGAAPLPPETQVERAWDANAGIDVLIGHTSQETRLFIPTVPALGRVRRVPVLGAGVVAAASAALTRIVYSASAARFAARHRRAGGRVFRYVFTWGVPGNGFGAAHAIEIPFLFDGPAIETDVALIRGASRDEMRARGREMRAVWAAFARGDDLPHRAEVGGVLRLRRA